jgi:multiple sugar transport system permease protein
MPALLIIALWTSVGGSRMVIFIAGLQGIPHELYEAAHIDGAGLWSRFRHVTIPLLTPTIFFNMVLGLIAAFQVFSVAFIGTRGGPANATYFYVLHIYYRGFADSEMGYAAALAWVFFLIIMAFTGVQFWLQRRWVHYEGGVR